MNDVTAPKRVPIAGRRSRWNGAGLAEYNDDISPLLSSRLPISVVCENVR